MELVTSHLFICLSSSASYRLRRFALSLLAYFIGIYIFIGFSCCLCGLSYIVAFISFCSHYCIMLLGNDSEAVDCELESTLLLTLQYILGLFGSPWEWIGPPVLNSTCYKLGIIIQTTIVQQICNIIRA